MIVTAVVAIAVSTWHFGRYRFTMSCQVTSTYPSARPRKVYHTEPALNVSRRQYCVSLCLTLAYVTDIENEGWQAGAHLDFCS